jgi:CheY-like chemotaxis protein
VVDDHVDSATALARLLELDGREVAVATSCADALQRAQRTPFDLYIIDLLLPDGDGCALLRDLLASQPAAAIAVSGLASGEDIERGTQAGFFRYLVKPVSIGQLREAVEQAMQAV